MSWKLVLAQSKKGERRKEGKKREKFLRMIFFHFHKTLQSNFLTTLKQKCSLAGNVCLL